jgi:hypothetical protein
MIITATTQLFPTEITVFKTFFSETRATFRARGLYTIGVQLLSLYYHIALTLLNHNKRRLLAGRVAFKTTRLYISARPARMTRCAAFTHQMEDSIFFLEVSAFWNNVSTDFAYV